MGNDLSIQKATITQVYRNKSLALLGPVEHVLKPESHNLNLIRVTLQQTLNCLETDWHNWRGNFV